MVQLLRAGGIDDLSEVSFLIEKSDADNRQTEVACGLQEITGEDAEPAGVERQTLAETEFHAEISDPA